MSELRQRTQELTKEYWDAREGGMTERVAVAQLLIRMADLERGVAILQENWPKTIPAPMDAPR